MYQTWVAEVLAAVTTSQLARKSPPLRASIFLLLKSHLMLYEIRLGHYSDCVTLCICFSGLL